MSRLSETNELIGKINNNADDVSADAIIAALLADIAVSLAVIADELKEQEHE